MFGPISPPPPTPSQFPRIRIVSQFSGIQSAVGNYTDGVTQLSECSRIGISINTLCTDLSFLVYNGNFSLAPPAPTGNAFMFKANLEYQGNSIPISFPSNTGQQMPTPAQTSGSGITTTVTTGASSATQTVGSTTNYQVGGTLNFATAGVNATIKSITSSTVVVLTSSISTTTGETVTIVGYQGSGTMLGDGQAMFSTPLGGLYSTATNYKWRHFRSCAPGTQMPYTGQQGNGPSGQNFNGNINTSDVVNGSTVQDGADYTTTINNTMASIKSGGYSWSPLAVIGRQIVEIPVWMISGDSVGFGFGSTYFEGYLGLACANAGVAYFNCGVSGITGLNQERYDGILQKLSRYVDGVLMQIGTNDINSAAGNDWFHAVGQGTYLAEAETFTGGIGQIIFSMVPQRTTSSGSLWNNYSGQAVLSTEPLRVQINNAFRDTSANGMAAYFAANLSKPATVGAPNDVWVASGMERNSDGTTVSLNATTYNFTCSSANATAGAIYTDTNGQSYTVGPSISAGTALCVTSLGNNPAPASGHLTYVSGSGDGTINYSSVTQSSSNQQMFGTGGYWLTNGTNNQYTADGIHPNGNAIIIVAPSVNTAPLLTLPSSTSGAYNTNSIG